MRNTRATPRSKRDAGGRTVERQVDVGLDHARAGRVGQRLKLQVAGGPIEERHARRVVFDDALHRFRERAQQLRIVEPRDEQVVDVEKQPEPIALFA